MTTIAVGMIEGTRAERTDPFYRVISDNIDRCGWHITAVLGEDDYTAFAYTIGNYEYGLPELLIIGTHRCGGLLNSVCERMHKRGCAFVDEELVDIGGKYPLMAVDVGSTAKGYTLQVGEYYETNDYSVQQIVFCDTLGRFPGDPDCEAPYCLIPILRNSQLTAS